MRLIATLGLLAAAAFLFGCSGSESEGSCSVAKDCQQAYTCQDGKCVQVECQGHSECPGSGTEGGGFCAPAGVDQNQPAKKFCSPIQCKTSADCAEGEECDEYKQCIPGAVTDVVPDAEDIKTPGDVEPEAEADTPVVPTGQPCGVCAGDAQCGELKCYPVAGGGLYCFAGCTTHDECPAGWMCYQLSNQGKQCVPMASMCAVDCLKNGCPEGKVCNQASGACDDGKAQCQECKFDWDCATGLRCYQDGGYCAPPCTGGTCPKNGTCQKVNAIEVSLCVSDTAQCCFGDDCQGQACPTGKYPFNGECVDCLNDAHCGQGGKCVDHACQAGQCSGATPYFCNNKCNECCTTAQCATKGPDFVCQSGKCTQGQPAECSYCEPPYAACTQINNVWSCVQCVTDADCTSGTCDPTLFSCKGGVAEGCTCSSDAECVSSSGQFTLACDVATKCCYDTKGWCDGVEAMCNTVSGSTCKALMDIGGGGLPIPMPEGVASGLCSCNTPSDIMALLGCLMGGCPSSPECFAGAVCVDPATIPVLGQMLGAMGPVCVNPSIITDVLGGGLPI